MFTDKHLNDVHKLDRFLCRHYNDGVSHADEKGMCYSIFNMWLVRKIIRNIIYLTRLENDGFCVTYDTIKFWVVH